MLLVLLTSTAVYLSDPPSLKIAITLSIHKDRQFNSKEEMAFTIYSMIILEKRYVITYKFGSGELFSDNYINTMYRAY